MKQSFLHMLTISIFWHPIIQFLLTFSNKARCSKPTKSLRMLCKPFSCTCTAGQLTPPRISMEQDFGILTAGKKNIWERTLKRQGNLRIKAAKRPGGETTNSNVFFPNSSDDWISISGLGSGASFLPSPRNRNTTTTLEPWNLGICGHQLNGLVAKSEGDHGFPHQIHCKFP